MAQPLERLGTLLKGRGGPKSDDRPSGKPVIRYGELYTHHNEVVRSFHSFVSAEKAENYTALEPGDVLFAGAGETADEIGKSAVFLGPAPAYGSGDMVIFRPNGQLDPHFLGYASNGPAATAYKQSVGQGSSILHIYSRDLQGLELLVPPLPEQRKIAAILSSVDNAITATRMVIEQARRVKQGLLRTLMTRGIGRTRFKRTEIGEIPESWEALHLGDVLAEGPRNGIYKTADEIGAGSLIVGQTAFTSERRLDFSSARRARLTSQEIATWGLRRGDVLITRVYATPEGCGRPAFVDAPPEPAVYESNMIRVRPNPEVVLGLYLFYWLQVPRVRAYLMSRSSSSNQTSINQKILEQLPVALPNLGEQQAICERLEELELHSELGRAEDDRLNSLKRGLMQNLLTGRVRVQPD